MQAEIFEKQLSRARLEDVGNLPRVVLIDTISHCNLKCSMRVHKEMKRRKGIMPWNLYTKIIDEIAEVGKSVRIRMVFLGEALLLRGKRPTIFDMITYAKSKSLTDVVWNSNANSLDEDASKGLIKSGLDPSMWAQMLPHLKPMQDSEWVGITKGVKMLQI